MGLGTIISSIVGKGAGDIFAGVKGIVDECVTTDKEKLQAALDKYKEENRHDETMVAAINTAVDAEVRDRVDARAREISLANAVGASWLQKNVQHILALFVVFATFACWYVIIMKIIPDSNMDSVKDLRSFLNVICTGVLWYYFGSNSASRSKDEKLYNLYNGNSKNV